MKIKKIKAKIKAIAERAIKVVVPAAASTAIILSQVATAPSSAQPKVFEPSTANSTIAQGGAGKKLQAKLNLTTLLSKEF